MTSDSPDAPHPPDEREQTDESLKLERVKTDAEIAKRQAQIDGGVTSA